MFFLYSDYLPQSTSRPFGFHRESPIHSVQFPKLEKRIDYPIVIESDSEEDELHFEEVKGKFQIIEKIGEGKKTVYFIIPTP